MSFKWMGVFVVRGFCLGQPTVYRRWEKMLQARIHADRRRQWLLALWWE